MAFQIENIVHFCCCRAVYTANRPYTMQVCRTNDHVNIVEQHKFTQSSNRRNEKRHANAIQRSAYVFLQPPLLLSSSPSVNMFFSLFLFRATGNCCCIKRWDIGLWRAIFHNFLLCSFCTSFCLSCRRMCIFSIMKWNQQMSNTSRRQEKYMARATAATFLQSLWMENGSQFSALFHSTIFLRRTSPNIFNSDIPLLCPASHYCSLHFDSQTRILGRVCFFFVLVLVRSMFAIDANMPWTSTRAHFHRHVAMVRCDIYIERFRMKSSLCRHK